MAGLLTPESVVDPDTMFTNNKINLIIDKARHIDAKSIASTGLTEEQAQKEGLDTVSATVTSRGKHGMIPEVKPWTLKLVFDKKTQKLIGGQIVSDAEMSAKEIDNVNALILGGKSLPDLTTLMCAGNPDLSSELSLEPISVAAEQALQEFGGTTESRG